MTIEAFPRTFRKQSVQFGSEPRPLALRAVEALPGCGAVALGTDGEGLLLKAEGEGSSWLRLSKEAGLPWRNVSTLCRSGEALWAGTSGGGLALVRQWQTDVPDVKGIRLSHRLHRYVSRAVPWGPGGAMAATGDGLVQFDSQGNVEETWGPETFENEYLTALRGDAEQKLIVVGYLGGASMSRNGGARWLTLFQQSLDDPRQGRPRDFLLLRDDLWFMATDAGLALTRDQGKRWEFLPGARMPLRRLERLDERTLVAAAFGGVLMVSLQGDGVECELLPVGTTPVENDVYDLRVVPEGLVLATGAGLSQSGQPPASRRGATEAIVRDLEPMPVPAEWPWGKLVRPVSAEEQPYLDQTYLFATTCGGEFIPHHGVDINVPPGTPIRAVANGRVRRIRGPEESSPIYIDHDERHNGWIMTTMYAHARKILVREYQRVQAGEVIALAGAVGRATNSHLHFEVRWRPEHDDLDRSRLVNPELWMQSADADLGTLAIYVNGRAALEPIFVRGIAKPSPPETPFTVAETPNPGLVNDAPGSGWIVIGDVPAGRYVVEFEQGDRRGRGAAQVTAGRLTLVKMPRMG